jgi:methionyl-tRNA formyltransferase
VNEHKIVLLGGKGISTNIVFHSINANFGINAVIIEKKENIKIFFKRRIRKLGIFTVIGQVLFQILIVKPLHTMSRKRIDEIIMENSMETAEVSREKLKEVKSVNSGETIELLKQINPDLVIVNGTRIISKKVLDSVNCKFINTHAGITPKYRGVHGAYWALVNNDKDNCGVTVHFVDAGIDTGNVLYQQTITIGEKDNFSTYPLLQLAEGLKLLNMAIKSFFEDTIVIQERNLKSHLWYHPTIWQYLYNRIKKNVR